MFSKILIANRGEIAVRVERACRDLGIKSAAVYSEADRNAAHVRLADEAYSLEAKLTKDTYLSPEKIIATALKAGADAIHPGYGFLSENPQLGLLAGENAITLIGPKPETIELMGSKLSARAVAIEAGVPVVPGTNDPISSHLDVISFGEENGWPVAIKASYGGGGRGLVVVYGPDQAREALERAKREAEASFGLDEAYLERYLEKPRHVEVQILADSANNTVAIGDRDCSLQRRHQKLIEEAPIPDISPEVREAILSDGEKLAQHAGYLGAGTIEMLYENGKHYFLEMNTRIQVEHPITEMVTGVDLIQAQIRIASGEKLWFERHRYATSTGEKQEVAPAGTSFENFKFQSGEKIVIGQYGHAIEVRINAEDPTGGNFTPSPGRITDIKYPSGPFVRVDAGYYKDDEMPTQFDSLLAKICAWGQTREEARQRLLRALEEFEITGIHTTKELSKLLLKNSDFIKNTHTTKTVESNFDYTQIPPDKPLPYDDGGEITSSSLIKRMEVEVDGRKYDIKLDLDLELADLITGNRPKTVPAAKNTRRRNSKVQDEALDMSGGNVSAPMQGTVISMNISKGEPVEEGQLICILEAMKMENPIYSSKQGTVSEVLVEVGDPVGQGDIIVLIS